jgi:hypothetical protein
VVRTMYRALEEGDDSIFARCLDPQAEWIHTMVARLPEQPTPIFAELYKLLSWAAMLLSHVYSPPFRLEYLCRNPSCTNIRPKWVFLCNAV